MGTNYYIFKAEECGHCGSEKLEKIHIGKNSHGWRFTADISSFKNYTEWYGEVCSNPIFDEDFKPISIFDLAQGMKAREQNKDHFGLGSEYSSKVFEFNGIKAEIDICTREFS